MIILVQGAKEIPPEGMDDRACLTVCVIGTGLRASKSRKRCVCVGGASFPKINYDTLCPGLESKPNSSSPNLQTLCRV